MDKFLEILKFLINTNTINFLIMAAILGYIIKKMNLSDSFAKGIEKIKLNISDSDKAKAVSKSNLDEAIALINKLPNEIKTLEENSSEKTEIFKTKIKENTDKVISNITKNVDKSIAMEEKNISNLLTEKTATDAIDQAKNDIEKLLEQNPQLHDQFIENSINELDKAQLR